MSHCADFDGSSKERSVLLGEYIVASRSTVRKAAKKFGISKSTVHKDIYNLDKLINVFEEDLYFSLMVYCYFFNNAF